MINLMNRVLPPKRVSPSFYKDKEAVELSVKSSSSRRKSGNLNRRNSEDDDDDGDDHYTHGNDLNNIEEGENEQEFEEEEYTLFQLYLFYFFDFFSIVNLKRMTRWFLDSANIEFRIGFDDISLLLTLYVLFAGNLALLFSPKKFDYIFTIVLEVCFYFFIFEFVANTWSKTTFNSLSSIYNEMKSDYAENGYCYPKIKFEGYFFTLFWFMDIIVIISMLPDIPMISHSLNLSFLLTSSSNSNTSLSKVGQTVRLVRIFRVIRAYRILMEKNKRRQQELEILDLMKRGVIGFDEDINKLTNIKRKSKLGMQLSASTTNRVIILILSLLFMIPTLLYQKNNVVLDYSTKLLQSVNVDNSMSQSTKDEFSRELIDAFSNYNNKLVYLKVYPSMNNSESNMDLNINDFKEIQKTRDSALFSETITFYNYSNNMNYFTTMEVSEKSLISLEALYSIILTIFIGSILLIANIVFTLDTQNLVLKPIERMMKMVENVAKNPLSNFRFDHEAGFGSYETDLLEKSFVKIAGLLRVGFGEAGAGIIKSNLRFDDGNSTSAIINPLLPGIRVFCIVGFCDIHQFEYITQQLERDVFTFVNTIASIVHESVHYWEGSCNKNLGNAFVIIWRIGEESALIANMAGAATNKQRRHSNDSDDDESDFGGEKEKVKAVSQVMRRRLSTDTMVSTASANSTVNKNKYKEVDLKRLPGVDKLAAKALIAYLKIIAEINKNAQVLEYRQDKRLTNFGRSKYKVQMGFGLHAGWAIEGAVGSLEKVDATYLSPHVNMAARLETSSRQYGIPLLASQSFYDLLSPYIQKFMRRLDVVTVKGSEMPIGIFTYDTFQEQEFKKKETFAQSNRAMSTKGGRASIRVPVIKEENEDSPAHLTISGPSSVGLNLSMANMNKSHSPFKVTIKDDRKVVQIKRGTSFRRSSTEDFATNNDEPEDVFDRDPDLTALRKHVTPEFLEQFNKGVHLYISGDWIGAKKYLEEANQIMKTRLPSSSKDNLSSVTPIDDISRKTDNHSSHSSQTGDGPSLTLLRYMESYHYLTPSDWHGYRPLTSK